jgi:hypothetical protein
MFKTIGSVKNCWFTNNGLPIDKICHLNLVSSFQPQPPILIGIGKLKDFINEIPVGISKRGYLLSGQAVMSKS